ncbi:MAG: hypothetical protein HZB13_00665, partial [Acidobacteria bacterium]|nr:hypothetical protein [Acidobacteriota bacterium]
MPRSEHSATAQSIPRVLPHAPDELAAVRLRRLGEGVGKVAYTSGHWVVKRERTRLEVIAIIAVWRLLRRLERFLPGALGRRLRSRPAGQIRLLRAIAYAVVLVLPRGLWFSSHLGDVWRLYRKRAAEGDRLARQHLEDTGLVPRRVTFPPMRVKIGGWPGWLTVSEASERVENTLYHRLTELAQLGHFDEIEVWLERFLELRQAGWGRGVFSVDAHLKNFGVTGDRVVLLYTG